MKAASGAMIVFASGVAYFAALPFAIPIGIAGGLLSISRLVVKWRQPACQEAFQARILVLDGRNVVCSHYESV